MPLESPEAAESPETGRRRILRFAGIGLIVGALALWLTHRSGPKQGEQALDFALPTTDGETVDLAKLRGRPAVIEVVAKWCDVCKRSAPMMAAAARTPRRTNVSFLAVSVDGSMSDARELKRAWDIPYAVATDTGAFAAAYRIETLPTLIVLDAVGIVRHVSSGVFSRAQLEAALGNIGAARR